MEGRGARILLRFEGLRPAPSGIVDETPRMDVTDAQFAAQRRLDRPGRIVETEIAAAIHALLVDELIDGMMQRLGVDEEADVELRGAAIEAGEVLETQRVDVARSVAREAGGIGPVRRGQRLCVGQ